MGSARDARSLSTVQPQERLAVLVVDDHPENIVALEAVLAPLALEVQSAGSGEEALRLLLERDFALILLDVRLPGMDGIETARLIKERERTRDTPIVFLTAARDEISDILAGYGVGAVDYVLKPFDAELLRSKVGVFIELDRSRRALSRSEAFLRSAFEAAPIGKTLLDLDRRIVRANSAFGAAIGDSSDALEGMAVADLCHPADREALSAMLDRGIAEADSQATGVGADIDLRLLTSSGREVWVAPSTSWIKPTELTAPLLLVQWVDVSARRHAERTRAELMVEQAARTLAEAQATRLEKLQLLVEALESGPLDDLLNELARRLVNLLEADAAELEVAEDVDARAERHASGAHLQRVNASIDRRGSGEWHEAPLTSEGARFGAVRIALPPGRMLTADESALLHDAAERVSLIVRGVQLHEQERRIAAELQRGLSPTRLPDVPGLAIAAHCEAAGLGAEVGGDWYDVFELPGGRLGVVIGDVTGSGIRAASAMGELRSVTRALAMVDQDPPSPAEALTRVHRYHRKTGFEGLFTVLYLILDTSGGLATWANAGHLPPLLRTATGELRTLQGGQSLMSLENVTYENFSVTVEEGDTLILYTDGLIERRGESIDDGLERLRSAIRTGPEEADALCAHVLQAAPVGEPADDLTALVVKRVSLRSPRGVVRMRQSAARRVRLTVMPDPGAPAAARRLLERSFADSLDPEELERAKLMTSELTTNAVRHGQGEITLRAEVDATRLLVEVIDQGSGFEPVDPTQDIEQAGGWGLRIVEAEASRWGMREGTGHVWFEIERRAKNRSAPQESAPPAVIDRATEAPTPI
ncbi:MAG TPA: SpoIIE family protein phosphatase [Solirubrobacteraceae bacterium]|nr:SpoIIE family protein phosphatase [Solirubrobacteraceae bacterium]